MACVSKTEIIDILKTKLPNDVLCHIVSYHAHPIIEYIGLDTLRNKYDNLKITPNIVYFTNHRGVRRGIYNRILFQKDYDGGRISNILYMNNLLSSNYTLNTIFYPLNTRDTKNQIYNFATNNGIKLIKSWTKRKMLKEYYKQTCNVV